MAISLVDSVSGSGTTSSVTTGSIDTTGADLIVVCVAGYTMSTQNISDSKANTYTLLTLTATHDNNLRLFYCLSPTVGSGHTFTFSKTNSYPAIAVGAFSGVASYDQESAGAAGSSSTRQPGSITPAESNALLVSCLMLGGSATANSIDSSFTIDETVSYAGGAHYGCGYSHFIQSTAAAINPTWTLSASVYNGSGMASFLASGASQSILPIIMQTLGA